MNTYVGRHACWFGWSARRYDADTTRAPYSAAKHRKP